MELTVDGESITQELQRCIYTENAGRICDSLDVEILDGDYSVRNLQLKKGDVISAGHDGIESGTMYISTLVYKEQQIQIRAASTDPTRFREKSAYKEQLSFTELVKEIERETGYEVNLIHPLQMTYIDVTRAAEDPLAYLSKRLLLESYQMRVHDGIITVYDERIQEKKEAVESYAEEDFEGIKYRTKDAQLIGSIYNRYRADTYTIKSFVSSGLTGRNLETNLACRSIAESERFSRGLMREANKYEFVCAGMIDGLMRHAGQCISLETGVYGFSGRQYIYSVQHDLIHEKQVLAMRKPIGGDY